jgi:hypothetical protein
MDRARGHQDAGEGRVGEQGNPPESARSEHQDTQEPRRLLENHLKAHRRQGDEQQDPPIRFPQVQSVKQAQHRTDQSHRQGGPSQAATSFPGPEVQTHEDA